MASLVTLVCSLVNLVLFKRIELANLIMLYLLGVVFVSLRYGQGPSILAAFMSVIGFDLLFVTPYYSLSVADSQYLITLAVMLIVSIVISGQMRKAQLLADVAALRERRSAALYALGKGLYAAQSEQALIRVAVEQAHLEFGCLNAILPVDDSEQVLWPDAAAMTESLRAVDLKIAQWVVTHRLRAGRGADHWRDLAAAYLPIQDHSRVLAVWVLLPRNPQRFLAAEQQQLLSTFLRQIGLAMARMRYSEQVKASQIQVETERLRNSLLSAISHDLRTPLATIIGSASALLEQFGAGFSAPASELSQSILQEAQRMARLVNNVLEMARLRSDTVSLNKQWYPVEEIVGSVLNRLEPLLAQNQVSLNLPQGIPLLFGDSVMIEQVLINLLENAVRHCQNQAGITLSVIDHPSETVIEVADHGDGLPVGQEHSVFDAFYQAKRGAAQTGVGLGLAICRAVVEAHGGTITAFNRPEGGALFRFNLPKTEPQPLQPEE